MRDLKRRVSQLCLLALHQPFHRHYAAEIAGFVAEGLMHGNIFQRYKYLGAYLARGFDRETRSSVVLSHYRFVRDRIDGPVSRALLGEGVCLWRLPLEQEDLAILLKASDFAPMEGEWQLQFLLGTTALSTVSFSFAPVPELEPAGATLCLIGGVQGGYGCRDAIRVASKANCEIAPTTMLVLAVKAVAAALGAGTVCGISTEQQVARDYAGDRLMADYDAIWMNEGAARRIGGFHDLSRRLAERDLGEISASHRRRTKLKRRCKAELLAMITREAERRLLRRL